MKPYRLSDRDVQWAIKETTKGTMEHDAFTDLLRCRRALRKIHRLATEEPGWLAVGIECIAAKALGKGEKS